MAEDCAPIRCSTRLRVAVVALLSATAVVAAESPSGQIEEVVVTATKRAESSKDVPLSISVMSGDSLVAHSIAGVEDLTRATPGISFNSGGSGIGVGVGQTNIEIRGVSSSSGASTVGVYFDDVAVNVDNKNGLGAPAPMLMDLNRVEVLRGPQGTLFGASSEGGTVRYLYNQATLDGNSGEIGEEVSATRHGGLNYQGTAVANAVLVPGVAALRVNVGYNQQSGWIDNYSLDSVLQKKGVNDNSTAFLRLAGLFKVGDHVTVTPQFIFQDLRSSDTPVFYLQDQAYYEANPYGVPPPQASDGLYRQHKQVAEPSRDRLYIPSVNVTADLGSVDLTSVTSYYYRPYDRITDGTTFDSYILAVDFLGRPTTDRAIAALPSPVYQPVTYRTFSQEFRLASHTPAPGEKAAKWVVGAYYSDQRADYSNNDYIPGLSAAFQSIYGYSINDPANSSLANPSIANFYPNDAIYLEQGSYDTKQIALFGEVEYPLTPRLHASVGLRATHATTSTDVTQGGFYAVGTLSPVFSYTTNVSDHYNSTTPKASLVYDVTDTATVYATAGKGFRLGGELYTPLPVGAGNICAGDYATFGLGDSPKSAYDSDSLWNYEVGTKGRALNNSLSFNAAGYYVRWSNLQQAIYLPTCGYYDTVNIGDAELYGAELELHYKPASVPSLLLGFSGGANHAQITRSSNVLTAAPGQNIPFSPRWTADVSAEYSIPVGTDARLVTTIDYDYTGPSNGSYQIGNPNYENPAYGVLNVNSVVRTGNLDVGFFVRNALNNHTVIQSPTINALVEGYAVMPMTAGIRFTEHF